MRALLLFFTDHIFLHSENQVLTRFWKTSLRLIVAPMEPRGVFSPAPRVIGHLCVMEDGDMWVVGVKTGNEVTMTRLWKTSLR